MVERQERTAAQTHEMPKTSEIWSIKESLGWMCSLAPVADSSGRLALGGSQTGDADNQTTSTCNGWSACLNRKVSKALIKVQDKQVLPVQ